VRTLAIGDIHGHLAALDALLVAVQPQPTDQFIFLGDYVDKGPNVRGVIDRLIAFGASHRAIFLCGNHDHMMIEARRDPVQIAVWQCLGGESPLASYSPSNLALAMEAVPAAHWDFLENQCRDYFETPRHIFVHGGIRASIEPHLEEKERLYWTTLGFAEPHSSGRTVVCGHTAQTTGHIADLGHTLCIDTAISKGGWLTCLDVDSFRFWQSNAQGLTRSGNLSRPGK
jgi:serine/threonine protein phosphatase 1